MSFLRGKAVFVFQIWFLNIHFHMEKKKKKIVWKGNYITMVGFFMAFAKDYGFIHLRNSLFIHRKDGCSYNAYRLFIDLLPTTSRPSVSRLSAMTPSGWRDGFCKTSRNLSRFWLPHLLLNVPPLMMALGLIQSEWSGNKSKLDLNVLAGHLSSLAVP